MVRTVRRTLLRSQLACNEASARTCSRQHDRKCRLKSSIYFNHPSLTTISFWVPETRLRLPHVKKEKKKEKKKKKKEEEENKKEKENPKRVKNLATPSSIFISTSSTGEVCSQPIRGNVRRIGRMFPEHVERSFLDPEYSFVAVRRILPTRFPKKSSPN